MSFELAGSLAPRMGAGLSCGHIGAVIPHEGINHGTQLLGLVLSEMGVFARSTTKQQTVLKEVPPHKLSRHEHLLPSKKHTRDV